MTPAARERVDALVTESPLARRLERVEEALGATRLTALLWAWPTTPERAIGAHWGVTWLGGDERERRRLLAQLRRDPAFQAAPDPQRLPRSRPGLVVMPYIPRPLQGSLHQQRRRLTVVVTHRRFGKTYYAVAELIRAACEHPGPASYAFIAPYRHQVKAVAWDALKTLAGVIPGAMFNESQWRADLPGGRRILLLGADNPDAMRGIGLDGVVFDEYGFADPEVFGSVIRPALADRQGFVIFIGTPNGRNAFAALYDRAAADPDALAVLHKASESGVLSAAELEAARQDMSPDEFAQEFEGAFEGSVRGSYYGPLIEAARAAGRIRPLSHQPQVPVATWWDVGLADSTAIVFTQTVGPEVHVIDYCEGSGEPLTFWAREVLRKPYTYSGHWFPPDVEAREYSTGQSRLDIAKGLGLRPARVVPALGVEDGIEQARVLLARVWFDVERCARLLDCLAAYRKSWDAKRQTYQRHPEHNWASHGADAFRYLAVGVRRADRREEAGRPKPYVADHRFNPLGQLASRRGPEPLKNPFPPRRRPS